MEQKEEKHSLTQQDIERHLQSALAAATPNVWPKLDLHTPQDKPAKNTAGVQRTRRFARWSAAAACVILLLFGGIYHYEYLQVVSVVGIDVNPSLNLSLNRRERVLKAEALNPDGAAVLDTDLKGKTLETAVNQVVDSLVEKGYLKEGQKEQAVLVSVSGKSETKAERVKTAVTANMENAISQKQVSAVVYDQTIQVTKELEELAQAYQVSVGKAEFIERLVQENETLIEDVPAAYERMMGQTIQALSQEIDECAYAVSPRVTIIQVEPAEEKDSSSDSRSRNSGGKEKEHIPAKPEENTAASTEDGHSAEKADEEETLTIQTERTEHPEGKESVQESEDETKAPDKPEENRVLSVPKEKEEPKETAKTEESSAGEELPETEETEETPGEATSSTAGTEEPESLAEEDYPGDTHLWLMGNPDGDEPPPLAGRKDEENKESKENETEDTKAENIQAEDTNTENVDGEDTGNTEDGRIRAEDTEADHTKAEAAEADNTKAEDTEAEDTKEKLPEKTDEIKEAVPAETEHPAEDEELTQDRNDEKETVSAADKADEETVQPEEDNAVRETTQPEEDNAVRETIQPEESGTDKEIASPKENGADKGANSSDDTVNEETGSAQEDHSVRETMQPEDAESDEQRTSAEETDALPNEDKAAKQIIRMKENVPDDAEPGDMVKTPKKGRQVTSNGTLIIFEEVEKKEYKPPVYASQLLGAAQSRLLCKGPGVFSFILADWKENDSGETDEQDDESDDFDEFWEMLREIDTEDEWLYFGPGYRLP